MDVSRALDQLSEIHQHLSRTEFYRGYRSRTVAATGFLAMLGAAYWEWSSGSGDQIKTVLFWVILAVLILTIVLVDTACDYRGYTKPQRRTTKATLGQFIPTLLVGGAVTLGLLQRPEAIGLLPGLWSMLYGLGIFSSRPYLPQGVGWVGLYFILCGSVLTWYSGGGFSPSWVMGGVFGFGQLGLAAVLYFNLERRS